MAAPDLVNLLALIEDAKCFALVRQHRWPEGVHCPACGSGTVVRDGFDETQAHRQRYRCKACTGRFDDLTGTVLAGHHQPLRVWVLCLYFMGLNLSNRQIAQELGLDGSDVQAMTEQLRRGLVAKIAPVRLEGEVEIDEVYVVAGHKGQPAAVAKGGGSDAAAGQTADPGPDAARRAGGVAHAGQRAAEDDPADHRGRRGQGYPYPHR
jgi:transposase-like protein